MGTGMQNDTKQDSRGHPFVNFENVRITYVPVSDREMGESWSGHDVIRIQAYQRGDDSQALRQGPEIPVKDAAAFVRLVSELCDVYMKGSR